MKPKPWLFIFINPITLFLAALLGKEIYNLPPYKPVPRTAALDLGIAPEAPGGKWAETVGRDINSETISAMITVNAENEVAGIAGRARPQLTVACTISTDRKPKKSFFSINVITGIAAGERDVGLGYDDQKPVSERWLMGKGQSNLMTLSEVMGHLASMIQARTVLFTFKPIDADPVTARFDVRGLNKHFDHLLHWCGSK